jgi:hypothetical protein
MKNWGSKTYLPACDGFSFEAMAETMIPPVAMPTTKAVTPIAIHKRGTPKAFLLQFIPRYFQNGTLLFFSDHGLENTSGDLSNATSNPAAGATSIPPIEKWGFLDHDFVEDII